MGEVLEFPGAKKTISIDIDYARITAACKPAATVERIKITGDFPAWVVRDSRLFKEVNELRNAGWYVFILTVPDRQQLIFSHPQIKPVPERFLNLTEAKSAQAELNQGRRA